MSFFSRALERDIDRLVRESPIPKSVQYDEQEFSNLIHRSYIHHSRGPTSVSATAKLQASSHASPLPTFNPFHSQQVLPHVSCDLNESTQSVAELFNSLKRDASTASTSRFSNASHMGYGGPRNISVRGRSQGILDYQERLEDCLSGGGDKIQWDDSMHEDRRAVLDDPELTACSLYMWIIKPEPELSAVRVEGKKSLADSEFWQTGIVTERLHEKLVKTQSGSVYKLEGNIIILDTQAAGFSKSLAEAFWNGFPEDWKQLIQGHFNQFQYNRELDVLPGSLPDQGEICLMEAYDDQSEQEDFDQSLDDSEVGLSEDTVEGILDTLDRDIDSVDSVTTDDDTENVRHNTQVVKPKRKTSVKLKTNTITKPVYRKKSTGIKEHKSKTNTTVKPTNTGRRIGVKEYTLTNWIIKPLQNGLGVHLNGLNENGIIWSSSAIEKRLDKNKLLTVGGSIYRLKGKIDILMARETGIPAKVIEKFKTGFPKEWMEIIQENFSEKKPKHRSKSATRGRIKNDHVLSKNKEQTPRCVSKDGKKSSMSEKIIRNKTVTGVAHKQNATISSTSSKGSLSKRKAPNTSLYVERPANIVLTPTGAVVDLDNLQRSRSGRLIKPPLSEWCGQGIRKGENGYYVTARTEYAKQYCDAIEDTIWNSGKRIRNKYWKEKNTENKQTATLTQIKKVNTLNSKTKKDKQPVSCDSSYNSQTNKTEESAGSDTQADSYPDLTKEIGIVLDKHKTSNMKRKSRRLSTLCYENCQDIKTSTTSDKDEFCIEDSDKEQNDAKVIKNDKKTKKPAENEVDQVSTVSSTTEDVGPRRLNTRSRTKYSALKSKRDEVLNDVTNARGSNRKSKRLGKVVEDESCSEHHNTSVDTVDTSAPEPCLEQLTDRLKENETDLDETISNIDDSHWTDADKDRLNVAFKKVDSEDPDFWDQVAKLVGTKSAAACQDQFYATEKSELGKKRKNTKKNEMPKVTALTANKGTLKRKQQLSAILKQHNENYTENVFDATPFRKTRKRKLNIDGEKCFEETLKRQGKSRFETPKAEDSESERRHFARMVSEKKTPISVVTIEENIESGQTDAYVHNLMKRGVHRKKLRKTTPKTNKGSKECGKSFPNQQLFIKALQNHSDEENHMEEDEDYYWEQDVTTD